MKLLKYLFGIVFGLAGVVLFIMTIAYAATVDASIGLPYFAMAFLMVSYRLILKEKK